ncbi:MerR family transcriptional regulator [Arthrobacter sp. LAPM80]|uniref:MerR family transcriptional regulator n=1 Tax=Arthrobacter sp. LAPM80 TaxID=3141788 RepID=UPI00398ACA4D
MSSKRGPDGHDADWSIQEIATLSGTTSRTLRHYDTIGLLPPSRIAGNGYRHYDHASLMRLQRILLLRELGLGLPAIAAVLSQASSPAAALRTHVAWLRGEQKRLTRLIASVEKTIAAETQGENIMAKDMLDGFEHTQYKEEVEQRWGQAAYAESDGWWRGKQPAEQAELNAQVAALNADWIAAFTAGAAADSPLAQELARRHVAWLRSIPGTPATKAGGDVRGYVLGLADMYVGDERFAANYGGSKGAAFVRDALGVFAQREL